MQSCKKFIFLILLFSISGNYSVAYPSASGYETIIAHMIPPTYRGVDFEYPVKAEKILFLELADLNSRQTEFLCKNGFIVLPSRSRDFYPLYENFRYDSIPAYVTADAMLHAYHLAFNKIIRDLEDMYLREKLLSLTEELCDEAKNNYLEFKGTRLEDAAQDVWTYFEIAKFLLGGNRTMIPPQVREKAEYELERILRAQGIEICVLMSSDGRIYEEDYSQYKPRGHYEGKPYRESYFRAMMWYGRISFTGDDPDDLDRIVMFAKLMSDPEILTQWEDIYLTMEYFVGKSKDLTVSDVVSEFRKVYGNSPEKSSLTGILNQTVFLAALKSLDKSAQLPFRTDEKSNYFRFMGMRFVLDSYIFQELVFDRVGTLSDPRMLPKGLDVLAAMGNETALGILEAEGDTSFLNFNENMADLREKISEIEIAQWESSVYMYWLYTLRIYTQEKGQSYPKYMRSLKWALRQIYAALASWTELKHDTVLYATQIMAECGEDIPYEKYICHVEPVPEFYFCLSRLVELTREALDKTGADLEDSKELLSIIDEYAEFLLSVSIKELDGTEMTHDDFDRLYYFGSWLEWIVLQSADERAGNPDYEWAGLVTDVATDPTGRVLQEATGKIFRIFVITPGFGGKPQLSAGGVFSYYEFPWPMDDRLTDSKWREMLSNDEEPPRPDWSDAFIVE